MKHCASLPTLSQQENYFDNFLSAVYFTLNGSQSGHKTPQEFNFEKDTKSIEETNKI